MMMPLIGCNQAYQYGNPKSHQWFAQWEAKGDYTMRYFIEPVALVRPAAHSTAAPAARCSHCCCSYLVWLP